MLTIEPMHKKLLLLFALYIFCSVVVVAFDPHLAAPSKTCAICFMSGSLFSAVNQSHVILEIDLNKEYVSLAESVHFFASSAIPSSLSYRGPPLPGRSL